MVWDSEGIAESEDKVLEEIFESVDADDGNSDSGDDSNSSIDDKKRKKGVKVEKKTKKRKKSKSSDDGSCASVDSSNSEASLGVAMGKPWTVLSKNTAGSTYINFYFHYVVVRSKNRSNF